MSKQSEPMPRPGNSYLFTEGSGPRAYDVLKQLLAEGRRGLVISRLHPKRVQQLYSIDCPIQWIAKSSKQSGGVIVLEPTRLMKIHSTVSEFIRANPGAAVLLDGLEYLITENGFGPVMKAVQLTNEEVAMTGSYFLVPIDPRALETQQLGFLEREFSTLDEHSAPSRPRAEEGE